MSQHIEVGGMGRRSDGVNISVNLYEVAAGHSMERGKIAASWVGTRDQIRGIVIGRSTREINRSSYGS